jgi:hypothetical protein
MTYTPQNLQALVPPVDTFVLPGTSPYALAIANHNDLYSLYEPPVASWHGGREISAGPERNVLRFLSRQGYDYQVGGAGLQLRVDIMAFGTAGIIRLYGGVSTVSVAVTARDLQMYSLAATPAAGNEEWVLSIQDAGIYSMVAYWVASTPTTRAYPSEWRQAPTLLGGPNVPIHTEIAGRLLNGPVLIARDRPACVFSHLREYDLASPDFQEGRAWSGWGVQDNTLPRIVARGRIPMADVKTRPFLVDCYLRSSLAGAFGGGLLRIGGTEVAIPADQWHSFEVDLGRADADVTATIEACGAGEWAYFETIQVWRMSP